MLGRAFKTLIPICVLSFIGLCISSAVEASINVRRVETVVEAVDVLTTHDGTQPESWELSGDYSEIILEIGQLNVELSPISGNKTTFTYTGTAGSRIDTSVSGDTLKVLVTDGTTGFGDFFDRLAEAFRTGKSWDEFFGTEKLVIGVPEREYGDVIVNLGSGMVSIDALSAKYYYFDIGSGFLSCKNVGNASELRVDMGSGRTEISGMNCAEYSIDIGSGSFDIDGLSGSGSFSMGSGSGRLGFSEINGSSTFDMGSGTVEVALPKNTSAEISADIGSGSVKVKGFGLDTKLRDGNSITLGDGEYMIDVDMNSGSISFVDADNSQAALVTTTLVTESEVIEEVDIVTVTE